jgi:hypothetical protein
VLRRFVRGLVRLLAAALVMAAVVAYAVINGAGHYPARWHNDPATIQLRGTPNDYLAAPSGTTAAPADTETPLYAESPRDLLARFHLFARAQPRTGIVAGDLDSLMITYLQRSRFIGFPDYLTVKVVEMKGGAGLTVYSRSRYGRGDFGVNRARVEAWLAALK